MAKKKHSGMGFPVFMILYAVAALTATFFGLKWFWGYMEAYERSRPQAPVEAYMNSVTPAYIARYTEGFLEQVDENIQSPEQVQSILDEIIYGKITCARNIAASTDTEHVYVVRSGQQIIGSVKTAAGETDQYGFTPWILEEGKLDLSFLMGTETVTAVAPEGFPVCVNGVTLDERYIVSQETVEYPLLAELYGKYDVPVLTINTYEAGPFLKETYRAEVFDPQGKPFVYDDSFDPDSLLNLTDEEQVDSLQDFSEEFLDIYVIFAGCANDNRFANYNRVIKYIVPGSTLAERMEKALDGMQFAQSLGDEIDHIDFHHFAQLSQDSFLVDVTYYVNTIGREGVVQTTNNVKLLLVRSGDGFLVESLISY
ncbi:MAG: hypothetical protein E7465_08825 [Ruminococcaceae bacterium]|nr:hypothetical protein [Oscillospiraceae bacterium]